MTITERLNEVGTLVKAGKYEDADKKIESIWEDYNSGVYFNEDESTYLTILTDEISAWVYEHHIKGRV